MTGMTLYSGPLSMFGAKAHIAALEKGFAIDVIMVPFTKEHRYDPKQAEVLKVNPKRQVPVLIHQDVEIFDSTQIFEYFGWRDRLTARPAVRQLVLQFADTLTRFNLPLPEFIERAARMPS
jgi:glutathione S-transferase